MENRKFPIVKLFGKTSEREGDVCSQQFLMLKKVSKSIDLQFKFLLCYFYLKCI